ncbi:MAG: hypothetical protein LBF22_06970 [Deltaproteobacteria bacterium]|jgi:hypothetical protein|nr:hypothetical protein [Deltaproteobacteria bacterium]
MAFFLSGCVDSLVGAVNPFTQTSEPFIYPKIKLPDVSKLEQGEKLTEVSAAIGSIEVISSQEFIGTSQRSISGVTNQSPIGSYLFTKTIRPPLFISTYVEKLTNYDTWEFAALDLVGGYVQYHPFKHYLSVNDGTNVIFERYLPEELVVHNDINKLSAFQDGRKVYIFLNDRFIVSVTFPSLPKGDRTGFYAEASRGYLSKLKFLRYFVATEKLAVSYMQSLDTKITQNISNFNSLFDIKISGGINKNKTRTAKNENDVAAAQVVFQTIDVATTIKPRSGANITYPIHITVSYVLNTVQKRHGCNFLGMCIDKTENVTESFDREYTLVNSEQVITNSESFEYMELAKTSDLSEDFSMTLASDPQLSVDVTELFY